MQLLILLLAFLLALIHVVAGKLRFLDVIPRSRWLSFAGGISVAYVFVHLLPELAEGQRALGETDVAASIAAESHVWIVALLGLALFYGLEQAAKRSRQQRMEEHGEDRTERDVFWLHAGSYGLYNILIGYLLFTRNEQDVGAVIFFWLAMALHFFVNDYGLRHHHRERYTRIGRWILAAAVLAGSALAFVVELRDAVLASLLAFLGGGVLLNVLKEELPEERRSRFWPFATGAAAYAALLLAI